MADKGVVDDLLTEFVAESQDGLDRMERCLTELERHPQDRALIDEIFRSVHTIKGATGFLGFGRLEGLAHAGETLLSSLRSGAVAVTPGIVTGLLELLDSLRSVLRLIERTGGEGQRSTDEDFSTIARLTELNESGKLGALLSQEDGETGSCLPPDRITERLPDPTVEPVLDVALEKADRVEHRVAAQATERTLRVDIEVLNRMMSLVEELVLTRNEILQPGSAPGKFGEVVRKLDVVTNELREVVMRARLQPVGHLFAKFPRLVRDLANVCGKRVRIEFSGQETGLDKSMIEAVRDPLTHAIRNAIDHGVEAPEQRVSAGKDPEGVIRLRAHHRSGSVVLEVEDDGAGISVERITDRAIQCGLIAPEDARTMTRAERLQLIFAPGFSTAERVTSVSGRGVGMDVVRENVEQVGGTVEVESTPGAGTIVRMRLPLTLANGSALIVRAGGQSFAIPRGSLRQLAFVPVHEMREGIRQVGNGEAYKLGRRLLPLVRLNRLLGMEGNNLAFAGLYIAVVEHDCYRFALAVDEIAAPEEIVVKPLSGALRGNGLFSGAAVLGSGELAFVLDPAELGSRAGLRDDSRAQAQESRGERGRTEQGVPALVYERRPGAAHGAELARGSLALSTVERIVSIDRERVKFEGGGLFMSEGEELLELIGEAGDLVHDNSAHLTVIVCSENGRRVGRLVTRVLEICDLAVLPGEAVPRTQPAAGMPGPQTLCDAVSAEVR